MTPPGEISVSNSETAGIEEIATHRPKRILFRTAYLSWIVVIFTTGIFVLSIIPYQNAQLLEEINARARVTYSSVAQVTLTSILLEDYSSVIDHCLSVINGNPSILYLVITRHDGFSLIITKEKWSQDQLDGEWLPAQDTLSGEGHIITSDLVNQEAFHRTFAFSYSGIDWGYIHVGLSPEGFFEDLKALYLRIFLTALIAVSLGFIASYFFARRLSTPILLLDKVTRQVASGDLSARVDIKTGDEIENLANSFNEMTTSLLKSKNELSEANRKLIETARNVGMTEVATGILHNVGNVLNSIGITTTSITKRVRYAKVDTLLKIADELTENKDDLASFFSREDKNVKFISLISALANHFKDEREKQVLDLEQLKNHIEHITEIINLQQSYSKTIGMEELVLVSELIEDAARISMESLSKYDIILTQNTEPMPPLLLDRQKILQILLNLINNAKHSLATSGKMDKKIEITAKKNQNNVIVIEVTDNGLGIEEENLDRIFNYGFTTKKQGHGFGLHSGALNAKEMGGTLTARSDGFEMGATFTLELPCKSEVDSNGQ